VNRTKRLESGASEAEARPRSPWPKLVRRAVSVWLVLHLAAIIIAPASVAPTSELILSGWNLFRPYLQVLYLDHGYHFFAPEPGESTLLSFVAERPDGTVVRGRLPDKAVQPRLLYHRYFMLTEHMNQAPEALQQAWYESYARHIGREYGAHRVSLTKQTHDFPTIEAVLGGVKLDDPRGYEEQALGVFQCGD
jgi:hypothetical protein